MTVSYLTVMLLVIVLGMAAINQVKSLADLSRQMYQHPFAVSNALLEANSDIIEIRQHLLEVVVAPTSEELERSVVQINEHEAQVYKHLDTVKAVFLGDPSQIEAVVESFADWKPIRSEIVTLVRGGRHEEARPMLMDQGKGGKHFLELTHQMDDLIAFARAKADEFASKGQDARNKSLAILLVMVVVISLLTTVIFVFATKNLNDEARKLRQSEARYQELYEKTPVLLHSVDEQGIIIDVSDYWLDHFGYSRDAVIGKLLSAFLSEESRRLVEEVAEPRFRATGKVKDLELEIVRSDGEIRIICLSASAKYAEDESFECSLSVLEDITERRQAEEAVLKSEASLKEAQRIAQIGSWELDIITNTAYWSDEVYRIFGLEPKEFGDTYESFLDHLHPDDREMVNHAYTESVKNKTPYNSVHRLLLKDGTVKFIHERGETFYDEDGKAVRSIGTVQDITERRRSEQMISRFSRLIEHSVNEIYIFDSETLRFSEVSHGARKNLGYSMEELAGMTPLDLKPEFTRQSFEVLIGPLRAGERQQITFETLHRRKDGSDYPVEVRLHLSSEAEPNVFCAIILDITNRKRAAAELAEKNAQFQSAFEDTIQGMTLVGLDRKYLCVNEAFCRMTGFNERELLELGVEQRTHRDDLEKSAQLLNQLLDGEFNSIQMERRYLHKDGHEIPTRVGVSLVRDKDGEPLHFVAHIQDLTALKESEAQLRQSQKMDAVGQLTGGIAHDFNNILGIVMGNLELLERQVADDPEMSDRVQKAIRGTERGASLTKKLLGFSRRGVVETRLTEVNVFIENLHELIAKSLTPSIRVKQHLAADLWPVEIDPGEFEDALLNLSLNARDAMPDGGALVIETANAILDETYVARNPQARAGEFVMISLSDTGSGMTDEVRERAFEPFFTTKEPGKGTGLGLSMIYGFVKRSGGHVKVYSELGEGTTFRVYLPRAREGATKDEETIDMADSAPGGNETILIVDDEADLVDVAVAHLEGLGYRTLSANDGKQALKLLEDNEDIDLMFSDVIMPGRLDGYKLALAARKIRPSLKILLTSGFTRKREESTNGGNAATAALAGKLLHKPYNRSELARAVRRTLDAEKTDET